MRKGPPSEAPLCIARIILKKPPPDVTRGGSGRSDKIATRLRGLAHFFNMRAATREAHTMPKSKPAGGARLPPEAAGAGTLTDRLAYKPRKA